MNKNNNKPKIIKEYVYTYLSIDKILKGSLKNAAKNILAIKDKIEPIYKKKYYDFELEYNYGQYDEDPELTLIGIRTETPEEIKERLEYNELKKAYALKAKKLKQKMKLNFMKS